MGKPMVSCRFSLVCQPIEPICHEFPYWLRGPLARWPVVGVRLHDAAGGDGTMQAALGQGADCGWPIFET